MAPKMRRRPLGHRRSLGSIRLQRCPWRARSTAPLRGARRRRTERALRGKGFQLPRGQPLLDVVVIHHENHARTTLASLKVSARRLYTPYPLDTILMYMSLHPSSMLSKKVKPKDFLLP